MDDMLGKYSNPEKLAAGKLLISEPFLFDENFRRTVVFLVEHKNKEGSVGFILNRPLETELKELHEIETGLYIPIYFGGPVQQNSMHFIHMDESLADSSEYIGNGVYWGGDFDRVVEMIENNTLDPSLYRFFLGYSGWGVGQLKSEVKENTWILYSAEGEVIFKTREEKMWEEILKQKGGAFKLLANSPQSPQLN